MQLYEKDIKALSLGASILGAGGGGSSDSIEPFIQFLLKNNGPIQLKSLESLSKEDFVMPLAYIGVPLVGDEKPPNLDEAQSILKAVEKAIGRKITALMPGEVGGANLFSPFYLASSLKLPLVDGDLIGRAFPEICMNACHLKNAPLSTVYLSDPLGNLRVVEASSFRDLEIQGRELCKEMGSSALFSFYSYSGRLAKKYYISGSISKAIHLGKLTINNKGKIPRGKGVEKIYSGTISALHEEIYNGFVFQKVEITCSSLKKIYLEVQNEYLSISNGKKVIVDIPDIITLQHQRTDKILSTHEVKVGQAVDVFKIKASKDWYTEEAICFLKKNHQGRIR